MKIVHQPECVQEHQNCLVLGISATFPHKAKTSIILLY
jgi:hypothetical protein